MLFQQFDTVISFVMIMLLLSLLITAFVQLWVAILGLRGRNLAWAVEQLFKEAVPELAQKANAGAARELARQTLSHGLLAITTNWLMKGLDWLIEKVRGKPGPFNNGKRPPTAVNREDITLALESLLASGALTIALAKKFPQREAALKKVVDEKLAKKDELVAALDKWFDLVMNAASEKFKLWSRWLTVVGAMVLAFGFQVDSTEILNQLSSDPELRAEVMARVPEAQDLFQQLQQADSNTDTEARVEALQTTLGGIHDQLENTELVVLKPFAGWSDFKANFLTRTRGHLSGLLMTVFFLSMGAPFWYGTLSNILKFRTNTTREHAPQNDQP